MGLVVSSSQLCDVSPGCRTVTAIVMGLSEHRRSYCGNSSVLTDEKLPERKQEGAMEGGLLTSWRGGGFP